MLTKAHFTGEECTLEGEPLGRNFTLRFFGDPALANRRANAVNNTLKLPGGKCEEKLIPTPRDTSTTVFILLDKASKSLFVEGKLKSVRKAMSEKRK